MQSGDWWLSRRIESWRPPLIVEMQTSLMLGKIEGERRRGWQRMRWLDGITDSTWVWVNSRSWWWTGRPGVLQSMGLQRVRHDWATELNWVYLKLPFLPCFCNSCLVITSFTKSAWTHGLTVTSHSSSFQRSFCHLLEHTICCLLLVALICSLSARAVFCKFSFLASE